MSLVIILVAVVFFSFQQTTSLALECATPNVSKTRVFDSLIHYQGNKITFNPLKGGWEGSNVEFNSTSLGKIVKNSFVTFDSEAILSLKLTHLQIKEIDNGAFISLLCLRELFLDQNNITGLTKMTFQDLNKLEKLNLSYNKLEAVDDLVFANLTRLKNLDLSNNQIKKFGELAFTGLGALTYLNLERNVVKKVPGDIFKPLTNLTILILSWNRFLEVEPEKWQGLDKLQDLELAGNSLDHFDPTYNFTFNHLKSLNVSYNAFTSLNVFSLRKNLPYLEMIDLEGNPWKCYDLEIIIRDLIDSRIKFLSGNCSDLPPILSSTTTEIFVNRSELHTYVDGKITSNNENLNSSIQSIRSFVIFVFSFLCVYIIFEIISRTNICSVIIDKFRGGNAVYVDNDTDVENFRLLHR